jgi:hypothetical protein
MKEESQGIGMAVQLENWEGEQIFMKSTDPLSTSSFYGGIYFAD